MESLKCQQCGLITWADRETVSCKRCGGPLWKKNDYSAGFSFDGRNDKSLFSGVIKFLTVLFGVSVLALIVSRVLQLGDAGKVMAVLFIVVGVAFAIFMNFW